MSYGAADLRSVRESPKLGREHVGSAQRHGLNPLICIGAAEADAGIPRLLAGRDL
jgi:hypothetical protein